MKRDRPVDSLTTPRFCGIRTFMRLPYRDETQKDFLVMGVPFDTTASYRVGARFAPQALREASVRLRQYHPNLQVDILKDLSGADYGDLGVVPGNTPRSHEIITSSLLDILTKKIVPVLLGGDHSITLPILRALKEIHGPMALIQFDAHHDTWDSLYGERYSHASPIIRAKEEGLIKPEKSILVGTRGTGYKKDELKEAQDLGFTIILTQEILESGIKEVVRRIKEKVRETKVYVTFDIDVLDPAYAPGTGTPEVGGLTSFQALSLLEGLAGINPVGFDLVEVLPAYDTAEITSLLGANIIHSFLSLLAYYQKKTGI